MSRVNDRQARLFDWLSSEEGGKGIYPKDRRIDVLLDILYAEKAERAKKARPADGPDASSPTDFPCKEKEL